MRLSTSRRLAVVGFASLALIASACGKSTTKAADTTVAAEAPASEAPASEAPATEAAAPGSEAPATEAAAPVTEAAATTVAGAAATGDKVGVALILKTLTNGFFVSMQKSAEAAAAENGITLTTSAGKEDGDFPAQIKAIEDAVTRGDKGILITPSTDDVIPALKKAKEAGLYIIALDTPPGDATAVDITFATDNYNAGQLIGQWAGAKQKGKKSVIAMLDLFTDKVVSVDTGRDYGFLQGMGIVEKEDKSKLGSEAPTGKTKGGDDYVIVCHEPTNGNAEGGKSAMEKCLTANPDINVVYTINEPAADGAFQALKAAGKEKNAIIVSVDGGCKPGLELVASGVIGATAQQYPGKMAVEGMKAIKAKANGGEAPKPSDGLTFFNTGVALVTGSPADGVASISVEEGNKICWGV